MKRADLAEAIKEAKAKDDWTPPIIIVPQIESDDTSAESGCDIAPESAENGVDVHSEAIKSIRMPNCSSLVSAMMVARPLSPMEMISLTMRSLSLICPHGQLGRRRP